MTSTYFIIILVAISSVLVIPAHAAEFKVGDEKGWTPGSDYRSWAKGKRFYVGDKLIFKYKQGMHNVFEVDGSGFKKCSTKPSLGGPLTSGSDVVTLSTPGVKYYICGVGKHCEKGKMALLINVLPPKGSSSPSVAAPAPAPAPASTL